MGWDAVELADELAERFSIATVDGGESDRDAVACLLRRYPLTNETAAGWRDFLGGKALSRGAYIAAVQSSCRAFVFRERARRSARRQCMKGFRAIRQRKRFTKCDIFEGRRGGTGKGRHLEG